MTLVLEDIVLEKQAEAQRGYLRSRALNLEMARRIPSAFVARVLRDEKTGKPVRQAGFHDEWQELLSAHRNVIFTSHIEAGKTSQVSIGRVLWELGKDTSLRIAIVSNTDSSATKIMRAIAQYIQKSDELHEVFPKLVPHADKTMPWNTQAIVVQRSVISKDPSVQCCGTRGDVLGSRIDILVLDDALDYKNTLTPRARAELLEWLQKACFGRMTDAGRIWMLGNAWHPEDAMHELAKRDGFVSRRYPVMDEAGGLLWPEVWPRARIDRQRATLGPLEFARQLLCRARDDTTARFKREWINVALKAGDGYRLVNSIDALPQGYAAYTGVDLSVGGKDGDLTVFFTILLHPDGRRQVLCIESGKWAGPEILTRLDDTCARFGSIAMVENNAAQDYILQFARRATRATVWPFTTGRQKAHPDFGVEGLAAEMASDRWIIPNRRGKVHPEVDAWITEMLYFNPREHTGDRLMGSWFAREAARRSERHRLGHGGQALGVRVIGADSGSTRTNTPRSMADRASAAKALLDADESGAV